MIGELGGTTSQLISLALDAATLRHQAIANNIANVNTPGYRALKVNFEEQLAAFQFGVGATSTSAPDLSRVKPYLQEETVSAISTSEAVSLDMEMAKLAQNVIHYQALLKAKSMLGEPLKLAINGGK